MVRLREDEKEDKDLALKERLQVAMAREFFLKVRFALFGLSKLVDGFVLRVQFLKEEVGEQKMEARALREPL